MLTRVLFLSLTTSPSVYKHMSYSAYFSTLYLGSLTNVMSDVPGPGDYGFREAISVASQHHRLVDVCRGIDLRLSGTDAREH